MCFWKCHRNTGGEFSVSYLFTIEIWSLGSPPILGGDADRVPS